MAIDTAERRRSAAGVGLMTLGPGVTPNATHDAEWRQQSAWGYSGIAIAGAGAPADEGPGPFVYRRDKRLRASKRAA